MAQVERPADSLSKKDARGTGCKSKRRFIDTQAPAGAQRNLSRSFGELAHRALGKRKRDGNQEDNHHCFHSKRTRRNLLFQDSQDKETILERKSNSESQLSGTQIIQAVLLKGTSAAFIAQREQVDQKAT
ncbi:uncharacterized protein LOC124098051 isoform X3 [Marmota monax]|uniref:uncharacterized protein LOC124098051 isoform X3 n=1 Tax=Marmota monax TaxID=9995 RepID=UPI001EB05CDA|nr:uncharacterized protein LOC124098051 isoform X3 [Marmota monax]